jgi:hypothetical protein
VRLAGAARPPAHGRLTAKAFLLVGALAHSGRWRGVLADVRRPAAPDRRAAPVASGSGWLDRTWRFDRMATVCHPAAGRVTATFAASPSTTGSPCALCPPRRGNRKGVVEKANHTARAALVAHPARRRHRRRGPAALDVVLRAATPACASRPTTAQDPPSPSVAAAERLRPLPATPFPAVR